MKRSLLYFLSLGLLLFLCSCPAEEPCYDLEIIYINLSDGQRNLIYPYQYVYGIGQTNKQLFSYGNYNADSGFALPLNLNSNTCQFVFVKDDGNNDTLHLKYEFNYYMEKRCGFQIDLKDLQIESVSSGFNLDSSSVDLNDYPWSTIKLRLK